MHNKRWLTPQVSLTRVSGKILKLGVSMDSWLAVLGISASRFPDWQILVFLLSRFLPYQIYWLADLLIGRFGYFCQQIPPRQISWLADFGISAGRFAPADLLSGRLGYICWQISWLVDFGISASRFPPSITDHSLSTILKLRVSMDNKSWLSPLYRWPEY